MDRWIDGWYMVDSGWSMDIGSWLVVHAGAAVAVAAVVAVADVRWRVFHCLLRWFCNSDDWETVVVIDVGGVR